MCVNVGPTPSSSPSGFAVSETPWSAVGFPRLIVGTHKRIRKVRKTIVNNPLGLIVGRGVGGVMGNYECVKSQLNNTYQLTRNANPSSFLKTCI